MSDGDPLAGRPTTARIAGQIRMTAGRVLWLASMMSSTGGEQENRSMASPAEAQQVFVLAAACCVIRAPERWPSTSGHEAALQRGTGLTR